MVKLNCSEQNYTNILKYKNKFTKTSIFIIFARMANKHIYLWFFLHGDKKNRTEDCIEGSVDNGKPVTSINHVAAMQAYLNKDLGFVDAKIINYILLRKEKNDKA